MLALLFSALAVGFIHTLVGPDHYIPFIVLAKSRHWSLLKTVSVTLFCGVGHVLAAAVLGVFAIAIGLALSKLELIESYRADLAAWLLIGFGFTYFLWGLKCAIKGRQHSHLHSHINGSSHVHYHDHIDEHAHLHHKKSLRELTPWLLFLIFIFGPCEPLIPLITYPAVVRESVLNTVLVTIFFGISTLVAMLFMVLAGIYSTKKLENLRVIERYGNALAGVIIGSCGLAIKFLGI